MRWTTQPCFRRAVPGRGEGGAGGCEMEDELVRRLRPTLPNHPELTDLVFNCEIESSCFEVLRWGCSYPEPSHCSCKAPLSSEDFNEEDSGGGPWICRGLRLLHRCGRARVGRALHHPGPRSPSHGGGVGTLAALCLLEFLLRRRARHQCRLPRCRGAVRSEMIWRTAFAAPRVARLTWHLRSSCSFASLAALCLRGRWS